PGPVAAETPASLIPEWITSLSAFEWMLIGGAIWMLGALVYLGRNFYRQYEFHKLIEMEASDANPSLEARAFRATQRVGLRRGVLVKTSLLTSGPLVTGLFKPVVLVPAWFEEDYTPAEQDAALLHEMMHVKRGDLLSLQIALIVMALQWFNPLAHVAVGRFRADQEAACDQDVLNQGQSSPRTYGETLVKTVAIANASRHGALAASLTLNHAIKERLILMQKPTPNLRNRLLGSAMIVGLGAFAMVATAQVSGQELDGKDDAQIEKSERHSAHVEIHNNHMFAIGQGEEGHGLVILGQPFAGIENLEGEINALVSESMSLVFDGDFDDLDILADLDDLSDLEELAELGNNKTIIKIMNSDMIKDLKLEELGIEMDADGEGFSFSFDSKNFDMAKFEAKMEAFEVRMEEFEEKIEARAAIVEERAEAFAEKYETKFESHGEAVEELSEACEDHTFLSNQPFVVLESNAAETPFRAVCAAGGVEALQSDEGKEFVKYTNELSDKEKEEFLNSIDNVKIGEDGFSFSFDRDFDFDFDFDFDRDEDDN
ncbi:MAG: M56 family metallopeptidase, partial [Pseudomonadota bacterium]